MAIRRHLDSEKKLPYNRVMLTKKTDMLVKSNLFEISLGKSKTIYKKITELYSVVDFSVGDILNIIHGNYEILIISNDKYMPDFLKILKGENIKLRRKGLASLSMKIPKEYIDPPGFYFSITKVLAMANIPIADLVNTESEATFILSDNDVSRAYDLLKKEITVEYHGKL